MNPNYRRFLLSIRDAYELSQTRGTQWIYGYCNNTIFFPLHKVEPGWLFKVYPGGRKILSAEGGALLKSWGINPSDIARVTDEAKMDGAWCKKCGQIPNGQGGEYPCLACGVPTMHDEPQNGCAHRTPTPAGNGKMFCEDCGNYI